MIYTISKKKYLILIILTFTFFLYGCKENIVIENKPQTLNKTDMQSISTLKNISETKTDIKAKDIQVIEDGLYQNKKEGFSIKILTGLKIQEKKYGPLVIILLPQGEGDIIKENLSISTDTQNNNKTIEEYYNQQKEGIQNHIKDYKEISKEKYKIAKTDGIKIIYQGTLGKSNLKRQQIIFNKNGKFFLITYTATQNTFDDYIKIINDIIDSINFK